MSAMINTLRYWQDRLGRPEKDYVFTPFIEKIAEYDYPAFICEEYRQQNGPDTFQRVLKCVPKNAEKPLPAVAVPFYYPEAMLGDAPNGREMPPEAYQTLCMMRFLAERGYMAVSAEAPHLTYLGGPLERGDFSRWQGFADKIDREQPAWSGLGKLIYDTQLLLDTISDDPRADVSRIGIAGHSLGGKMAFYTGCLDPRVKVICASDFGIVWGSTNWNAPWYWGERLKALEADGADHKALLRATGCKPIALIAGEADTDASCRLLEAAGYTAGTDRLCFINHATGHRPPLDAQAKGYDFLDLHLKQK